MIASMFWCRNRTRNAEDATRERVLAMKAFGAKVILTPKDRSMEGAIDYANEQVASGGYLMQQFANPITIRDGITIQPALRYGEIRIIK